MRRVANPTAVIALCVALGAAACSSGSSSTAGAKRTIQVDAKTSGFVAVVNDFFPLNLEARPGDTIHFVAPHISEPHTITLGTLVNAAVQKLQQLGPNATVAQQLTTTELQQLPDVLPHRVSKKGAPSVNHSAAEPCFLDSGTPPTSETGGAPACPKRKQPDFDQSKSFYNSGALIHDGDSFTMRLSPKLRPGSYGVIDLIHPTVMRGTITVGPPGAKPPSPAAQQQAAGQQKDEVSNSLQPTVQLLRGKTGTTIGAGLSDPTINDAHVAEFGPASTSVPVGGTLTWSFTGTNTVSFNAPAGAQGLLRRASNGTVELNLAAWEAKGMTVPPDVLTYPPPDNAPPVTIDGGKWDGTGFLSTGTLNAVSPGAVSVTLTFTKPGTYHYACLVHTGMAGTVVVR